MLLFITNVSLTTEFHVQIVSEVSHPSSLHYPSCLLLEDCLQLATFDMGLTLLKLGVGQLLQMRHSHVLLSEVESDLQRGWCGLEGLEFDKGMRIVVPTLLLDEDVLGNHFFRPLKIYSQQSSR